MDEEMGRHAVERERGVVLDDGIETERVGPLDTARGLMNGAGAEGRETG